MASKAYRLSHADLAIELLRPLVSPSDYEIVGDLDIANFAFIDWRDSRPQPEVYEIQEIVYALKNLEDAITPIYTEAQLEIITPKEESPIEQDNPLGGSGGVSGLA